MAKPTGIRVNTGAKIIEVNDKGDTITLNLNDEGFNQKYLDMLNAFDRKFAEVNPIIEEIDKKEETFDAHGLSNKMKEGVKVITDFHREIRDCVDDVFGADTCLKVFGNILPSSEMFSDFFSQLKPFFDEHRKERMKKLGKYNANRQGNV